MPIISRSARVTAAVTVICGLAAGACASGDSAVATDGDKKATSLRPVSGTLSEIAAALAAEVPTRFGEPEGELRILALPGFAEHGAADIDVDWVSDFEAATQCTTTVVEYEPPATVAEVEDLIDQHQPDVVAATAETTLGLIGTGKVAALNPDFFPNRPQVQSFLLDGPWNSVNGVSFAMPAGWQREVLVLRRDNAAMTVPSWEQFFTGPGVAVQQDMRAIATAALYLSTARPDLKIANIFALDERQLAAVTELLIDQRSRAGIIEPVADPLQPLIGGEASLVNVMGSLPRLVRAFETDPELFVAPIPTDALASSDSWLIRRGAANPNCAYLWLNWMADPETSAIMAESIGRAPISDAACSETIDVFFCTPYGADDPFAGVGLVFFTTPMAECLDGRTEVECTTLDEWRAAWKRVAAS